MSDNPIPVTGQRGYFEFLTPFDTQAGSTERFTVKSIRLISDYVNNNEDVKADVYTANGIESEYDAAVAADMEILGLQSAKGHWIYIPADYVKTYPILEGVAYQVLSLVIPLQPMPVDTDLTDLKAQLVDVITTSLGFTTTVSEVASSRTSMVSVDKDTGITATRAALKATTTKAVQIATLQDQLALALEKVSALESYIIDAGVAVSST